MPLSLWICLRSCGCLLWICLKPLHMLLSLRMCLHRCGYAVVLVQWMACSLVTHQWRQHDCEWQILHNLAWSRNITISFSPQFLVLAVISTFSQDKPQCFDFYVSVVLWTWQFTDIRVSSPVASLDHLSKPVQKLSRNKWWVMNCRTAVHFGFKFLWFCANPVTNTNSAATLLTFLVSQFMSFYHVLVRSDMW